MILIKVFITNIILIATFSLYKLKLTRADKYFYFGTLAAPHIRLDKDRWAVTIVSSATVNFLSPDTVSVQTYHEPEDEPEDKTSGAKEDEGLGQWRTQSEVSYETILTVYLPDLTRDDKFKVRYILKKEGILSEPSAESTAEADRGCEEETEKFTGNSGQDGFARIICSPDAEQYFLVHDVFFDSVSFTYFPNKKANCRSPITEITIYEGDAVKRKCDLLEQEPTWCELKVIRKDQLVNSKKIQLDLKIVLKNDQGKETTIETPVALPSYRFCSERAAKRRWTSAYGSKDSGAYDSRTFLNELAQCLFTTEEDREECIKACFVPNEEFLDVQRLCLDRIYVIVSNMHDKCSKECDKFRTLGTTDCEKCFSENCVEFMIEWKYMSREDVPALPSAR